jgi:hypothetical protein
MKITRTEARAIWAKYADKMIAGVPTDGQVEIYRDTNKVDCLYYSPVKAVHLTEVERMLCHAPQILFEEREAYSTLHFITGKTVFKVFLLPK